MRGGVGYLHARESQRASESIFARWASMDLETFCRAIDNCPDEITRLTDLPALYEYVGLPVGSALKRDAVSEALRLKMTASFTSGHKTVWQRCRRLREALIQKHVIDQGRLDPYFSVLDHLQDAMRMGPQVAGEIAGDWNAAIRHALDSVKLHDWSSYQGRERIHVRAYEVAKAAKRLLEVGFRLSRNDGVLKLEPAFEVKLVEQLEKIIGAMGGINVARRIFTQITPLYDSPQERYHLVRHTSPTGSGSPMIPVWISLAPLSETRGWIGTEGRHRPKLAEVAPTCHRLCRSVGCSELHTLDMAFDGCGGTSAIPSGNRALRHIVLFAPNSR
jgi:hypothetical protein